MLVIFIHSVDEGLNDSGMTAANEIRALEKIKWFDTQNYIRDTGILCEAKMKNAFPARKCVFYTLTMEATLASEM